MTQESEDVRVRQYPGSPVPELPRLFGETPVSAVEGAGGGVEAPKVDGSWLVALVRANAHAR